MDNRDTSNKIKPSLLREYEFFGGCIRVKISVKNTSSLAILDAALELESDEKVLHFDRCEPEYPEKKGKILLGNIHPNTDRTIAFYLDPLICAKEGTDINCRVSYKDASGRPDSVQMETLKIKVVCPIFRTEQDVNIGRLKELVSGLQFHDSKVYTIPKKVEISELLGTCRDVILLHDVRHIKTFKTTDERTYEAWYYGKTKVAKKDLVIKCSVQRDTESIEVFAAGNDPSDITGLLAEIGRNLTKEFEKLGKVQPVFNIHIKNSIIQRSNLLSFCNLDGTCGGDVVIEDSVVQRTNIASWNEGAQKEKEEAQKREKEEQERLRRLKEQEEKEQRDRKAREDAEKRESERLKARQEEERIAKEREKLSVSEKKAGISQIKYLAVALVLGVLLIGYWVLAPGATNAPEKQTLTPTPIPTPIPTPTPITTTTVSVEYFYDPACPKCAKASPVIESVVNSYGDKVVFTKYNVLTDEGLELAKKYQLPGIPAVVINKEKLIAYEDYNGDTAKLETILKEAIDSASAVPAKVSTGKITTKEAAATIAENLVVEAVDGVATNAGTLNTINIIVRCASGATDIDLSKLMLKVKSQNYYYSTTGTPAASTFRVYVFRDPDNGMGAPSNSYTSVANPILKAGAIARLDVDVSGLTIQSKNSITIALTPEKGATFNLPVTIPAIATGSNAIYP